MRRRAGTSRPLRASTQPRRASSSSHQTAARRPRRASGGTPWPVRRPSRQTSRWSERVAAPECRRRPRRARPVWRRCSDIFAGGGTAVVEGMGPTVAAPFGTAGGTSPGRATRLGRSGCRRSRDAGGRVPHSPAAPCAPGSAAGRVLAGLLGRAGAPVARAPLWPARGPASRRPAARGSPLPPAPGAGLCPGQSAPVGSHA